MARLHLVPPTGEEVELVASHLDEIAAQMANDFEPAQTPRSPSWWRLTPRVFQPIPYVVYAREMSETVPGDLLLPGGGPSCHWGAWVASVIEIPGLLTHQQSLTWILGCFRPFWCCR